MKSKNRARLQNCLDLLKNLGFSVDSSDEIRLVISAITDALSNR